VLGSPADGTSAAADKRDFGTSRWQLSDEITPAPKALEGERDVQYWPLAAAPVGDCRGCFRGQSGHGRFQPSRQLLTHYVSLRPLIAALRKVYSITSSAVASSVCGKVRPSAFAVLKLSASSNRVGN